MNSQRYGSWPMSLTYERWNRKNAATNFQVYLPNYSESMKFQVRSNVFGAILSAQHSLWGYSLINVYFFHEKAPLVYDFWCAYFLETIFDTTINIRGLIKNPVDYLEKIARQDTPHKRKQKTNKI